jgi:hypothetical protein
MESSLEARLDAYPDLPPGERTRLRAEVEVGHPDLRAALDEAEALARLLDGLRGGGTATALAELAAARATGTASPEEEACWARLEARARNDEALRARMDAVQARTDAVGAALTDPVARFEGLIRAAGAPQVQAEAEGAPAREDRAPRARLMRPAPRWGRVLMAASVAVVAVLGALRLLLRPVPYAFTDEEVSTEEFGALRSDLGAESPTDARYLDALDDLAGARRSFLGVARPPDRARLGAAAEKLEAVVQASPPGSFVRLEAAYRLAKARLLLGDEASARRLLMEVVEGEGRYASEAATLLGQLPAP